MQASSDPPGQLEGLGVGVGTGLGAGTGVGEGVGASGQRRAHEPTQALYTTSSSAGHSATHASYEPPGQSDDGVGTGTGTGDGTGTGVGDGVGASGQRRAQELTQAAYTT